mgnify:FL=1
MASNVLNITLQPTNLLQVITGHVLVGCMRQLHTYNFSEN